VLSIVAHLAPPIVPAELWRSWNWDPVVWLTLLGLLVLHTRGWRHGRRHRGRRWAFVAAIVTIGVALLSPLDALSSTLASAHMVQHLLLTIVVAPLLVISRPTVTLLRGLPHCARRDLVRLRRVRRVRAADVVRPYQITCAAVFAVALWAWHASSPYELALRNDLVHRLEHLTFLVTAVCSWAAIALVTRHRHGAVGTSVLVLFGLSLQGSILGALLTFATQPWYPSYEARTGPWGLTPLEDQQLAGVIMWVPAGVVYLGAALGLMTVWISRPPATRAPFAAPSQYAKG
jgi:cytochrome c oxidase assembly factor CtaG